MARPRAFDTQKAIANAMDVFWARGYDGASLPDLLDGMGITRGSLYKAFTDKRSLFLTVMDRYEKDAVLPATQMLRDAAIPNGVDRIEVLFLSIIETVRSGDRRGCLLCAAAAGPACEDAEIGELVQGLLGDMKSAFEVALQASDVSWADNAAMRNSVSDMLVSQYVGLRTLVRGGSEVAELDQSVTALISLLRAQTSI